MTRSRVQDGLDLIFSLLCVGPLTILYWRGTFNTATVWAVGGHPTQTERWWRPALLYCTGLIVKVCLDLAKHWFGPTLSHSHPGLQKTVSLVITYLDSLFGVILWVGGFRLLYVFPGLHWTFLTGVLLVSTSLLFILRAFHCTSGTPLKLITDEPVFVFSPTSYWGTSPERNGWLKVIGDVIFSYLVIHSLVVCCWWSMWELENNYILFHCEITIKDVQAWDSVVFSLIFTLSVSVLDTSEREKC